MSDSVFDQLISRDGILLAGRFTVITPHRWWDGEEPDRSLDGAKTRLGRLRLSEQFAYVFDLGDNWQHGCTVGPKLVDPLESLGTVPDRPLPCWGWGDVPDQYVSLAKTADRSVLGCMNDMAFMCETVTTRSGGLAITDIADLNQTLRRNINSARGYQPPIELTAERLRATR